MTTAEAVIERHGEAINERDVEAYLGSTNFPFTYQNYNGVSVTVDSTEAYEEAPWPWEIILRTDPKWSHTVFDEVEEVARSVSSAVFKLVFRRVDEAGESSDSYQAIWIATHVDGEWGVQFRHNLGVLRPA